MRKRIGSKLYDTDSAELICSIEGGQLFRKRTRDREWFAVFDDGTIRPLDVYNPLDVLLMETGKLPENTWEESHSVMIRVDPGTHAILKAKAKAEGLSITELMRRIAKGLDYLSKIV